MNALSNALPDAQRPTVSIDTAIVFVSGAAADRRLRFGGWRLLDRALLATARAGVRRCFIAGGTDPVTADARYPEIALLPSSPAAAIQALHAAGIAVDGTVLCLNASTVFHPPALAHLRAAHADDRPIVLDAQSSGGVQPMAAAVVHDLPVLWTALATGDASALRRLVEDRRVAVSTPAPAFAALVRSADDIPPTERALLLALENPRDGRIDALLNRHLSRPLSRLFLRSPLRPNHITVLGFLVAILGAVGFAQGTYVGGLLGALLFQFAAVLDCCDGEVARVKFQESKLGDLLDISLDAIANIAIFVGIAWGVWSTGQIADARDLGFAVAAGIAGTFIIVTYVERQLPENSPSPYHRAAQQLVSALTTRDFSVIVALAAATDVVRWLLWGAAVGANVFWVVLLGLVLRGRAPR